MKYKFEHYFCKSSFLLLLIIIFTSKYCLSQKLIKLNEVAKFELMTHGGGLTGDYRKIDVILENGGWKSYQTGIEKSTLKELIKNTSKIFIKDVPFSMLNQLLKIIDIQDSRINIDLFKINTTELVNITDSVNGGLQPSQKNRFVKAVQSKDVLQKALENVFVPFIMDDRTYYGITITTKKNVSFTIKAYSFADLYNLPWNINNIKSYDPNISIIFEFISGNDWYYSHEKEQMYLRLGKFILKEY